MHATNIPSGSLWPRNAVSALIAACMAGAAVAGPISDFERKPPTEEFDIARPAGDVERCLIDRAGMLPPQTYRQPDRPGMVTLIWPSSKGKSLLRIDLLDKNAQTHLRSWAYKGFAAACGRSPDGAP